MMADVSCTEQWNCRPGLRLKLAELSPFAMSTSSVVLEASCPPTRRRRSSEMMALVWLSLCSPSLTTSSQPSSGVSQLQVVLWQSTKLPETESMVCPDLVAWRGGKAHEPESFVQS